MILWNGGRCGKFLASGGRWIVSGIIITDPAGGGCSPCKRNSLAAVDLDKIDARYDKGVLTVTCSKKEEVKPKAIEIKTA